MRRQQFILGGCGLVGMICLILDSNNAMQAAAEGVNVCLKTLIPSLFPFFVFSAWINASFSHADFSVLKPVGTFFHMPAGTQGILISAFLGGYPVGAQTVYSAYKSKSISSKEAERLLSYCSNAGPAFLFGIVAHMFQERNVVWVLWGIHIVSAWMVSCVYARHEALCTKFSPPKKSVSETIHTSLLAMAYVCGWVIVFRIILGFLQRWILWLFPLPVQVFITGILELANGCCNLYLIENFQLRFVICSVILAFGGLCVTMQTASVIQELSLRPYILGKAMQCVFSLLLSLLYIKGNLVTVLLLISVIWILGRILRKLSGNLKKAVV